MWSETLLGDRKCRVRRDAPQERSGNQKSWTLSCGSGFVPVPASLARKPRAEAAPRVSRRGQRGNTDTGCLAEREAWAEPRRYGELWTEIRPARRSSAGQDAPRGRRRAASNAGSARAAEGRQLDLAK